FHLFEDFFRRDADDPSSPHFGHATFGEGKPFGLHSDILTVRRPQPVHLQSFPQGVAEVFQQLFAGVALGVDARNFLDPADPPFAVLLDDGGVVRCHDTSPTTMFSPNGAPSLFLYGPCSLDHSAQARWTWCSWSTQQAIMSDVSRPS